MDLVISDVQINSPLFQFVSMIVAIFLGLAVIILLRPKKYRRNMFTGKMEEVRKYRDPLEDIKRR